ncbi:MAG TPA: hypothetical protein VFV72_04120 [Candidatus Limnocylindrales bacterium]|nr:hypothetical protein [Candidatus Limnocylindrales bacterium]
MKKPYIPIMTPIILATALLGAGPGVTAAQAAEPESPEPPQHIEHFDLAWSTDLGGATVQHVDVDGISKVFVLPDGRASLQLNSRMRVVTTENGVVTEETVWQQNEQIKIGLGEDFVYRSFDRVRSSTDGSNCVTRVVLRIVTPDHIVANYERGPDC